MLCDGVHELVVPQYLFDNIDRILAVRSRAHETNEAFARTILDQIVLSAVYEHNCHVQAAQQEQQRQQRALSQPEKDEWEGRGGRGEGRGGKGDDAVVLELQPKTNFNAG